MECLTYKTSKTMKKAFLGVALSIALFSCTNENDILTSSLEESNLLQTRSNIQTDFSVVNGCVHFANMEAYQKILFSLKELSEDELLEWSRNNGYTSLFSTYKQKKDELNLLAATDSDNLELEEEINQELASISEATLHNENGIMFINDTIYKVVKDYMYVYKSQDVYSLIELNDNPEKFPHTKYKHTYILSPEIQTRGVSDGDRSYVINVTEKRREFVKFGVSLSVEKSVCFLNVKMTGQAQKKGPLGRWKLAFKDEIRWGQCICNEVYINDKRSSIAMVGQKEMNKETIALPPMPLGTVSTSMPSVVDHVKAVCTFKFCKNEVKGDEIYSYSYNMRP